MSIESVDFGYKNIIDKYFKMVYLEFSNQNSDGSHNVNSLRWLSTKWDIEEFKRDDNVQILKKENINIEYDIVKLAFVEVVSQEDYTQYIMIFRNGIYGMYSFDIKVSLENMDEFSRIFNDYIKLPSDFFYYNTEYFSRHFIEYEVSDGKSYIYLTSFNDIFNTIPYPDMYRKSNGKSIIPSLDRDGSFLLNYNLSLIN